VIPGGVVVDDVTEYQWVEEGENLVGCGQEKRNDEQHPVLLGVLVEKLHR
jgi:hypothetical protein